MVEEEEEEEENAVEEEETAVNLLTPAAGTALKGLLLHFPYS